MSRSHWAILKMAADYAVNDIDYRRFLLGSVGIRTDGKIVYSRNISNTDDNTNCHHAEARLARKLDKYAVVYVSRIFRDGEFAMAKPCVHCQNSLAKKKVKRVYYTIDKNSYGIMDL